MGMPGNTAAAHEPSSFASVDHEDDVPVYIQIPNVLRAAIACRDLTPSGHPKERASRPETSHGS